VMNKEDNRSESLLLTIIQSKKEQYLVSYKRKGINIKMKIMR